MSTAAISQSTRRARGRSFGARARPASFATQIAAAPSVRGEALPAVMGPAPLWRANAGLKLGSFFLDVSARGQPALPPPLKGINQASEHPPPHPLTARRG